MTSDCEILTALKATSESAVNAVDHRSAMKGDSMLR